MRALARARKPLAHFDNGSFRDRNCFQSGFSSLLTLRIRRVSGHFLLRGLNQTLPVTEKNLAHKKSFIHPFQRAFHQVELFPNNAFFCQSFQIFLDPGMLSINDKSEYENDDRFDSQENDEVTIKILHEAVPF